MPQDTVEEQRWRLQYTTPGSGCSPTEELPGDDEAPGPDEGVPEVAESVDEGSSEEPAGDEKQESDREEKKATMHDAAQLGHYIFSIRRRSRTRTPHLLGECRRTPGADYGDWKVAGEVRPHPSEYTRVCRQC